MKLPRLDIVIENAGIATSIFDIAEGHERTITVNVISTFLLGILLLPKLKATAKEFPSSKPRLSIVTSDVHAFTGFPERKAENTFAELDKNGKTATQSRYPTSKLLEVLVVRELAPKLADSGVIFNMMTLGLCKLQLSREEGLAFHLTVSLFGRSTEAGSRTLLAGASAGAESHGAYLRDGKLNNTALSSFVRSQAGLEAQKMVRNELSEILEEIQPGITRYLGVSEEDGQKLDASERAFCIV